MKQMDHNTTVFILKRNDYFLAKQCDIHQPKGNGLQTLLGFDFLPSFFLHWLCVFLYLRTTTFGNQSRQLLMMEKNLKRDESDSNESIYVNMETAARSEGDCEDDLSVLSADGIYDTTGFVCICLVTFIGEMTRGVFFPSLWLFVEHLGGSTVTLGYAVAAFSFGRILVNPLFGSWSQTIGYKKTLLIACIILLVGTFLYAGTYSVGVPAFLILAQTILGIGSGTLGVTRAFLAEITPQRNRTTYMAWLTAMQYAGFAVTPIAGAFFNYAFRDNIGFLNMFTVPALFMGTFVLGTIFSILCCFQDRRRSDIIPPRDDIKKSQRRQEIDRVANDIVPVIGLSIYDCCIIGCMLLNASSTGSIASFETLGIKIAESHFEMMSTRAGLIVGICGSFGVITLLSVGYISRYFSDVHLITGGVMIMSISSAIFMTLEENEEEYVKNPTWKYCVSFFLMYAIGYPMGHTAVIGLFSKVLGRRPQGTLQGWYASAGSLARILFPLLSGYILNFKNVETLFGVITFVLLLSCVLVMYYRKALTLLSQ